MNFLDTYDIAGSNTPPSTSQVDLNEEVNQVLGQLSGLWSWGKKQSQVAFETARKDLTEAVTQAQIGISKLTETAPTASAESVESTEEGSSAQPNSTAQTLFSRLHSAIPPNVVSAVQNNIPESLKHASENIDLAQLRSTLSSEFHRVQGVTRVQAEEYMHKSEAIIREAVKEAGEALRDVVKVIPPESSRNADAGLLWDGTDMWMLPDVSETNTENVSATDKGKGKAHHGAVATRAEALLKRLKRDPDIIRHDPEAEETVKAVYTQWLSQQIDENGSANWSEKIASSTDDSEDGQALQETLNALVPAEMEEDIFWRRYFFRVHQIEQEEARRKSLIEDSIAAEEEFSWEDEDEEASPTKEPAALSLKKKSSTNTLQASEGKDSLQPSTNTSPRESSEDGYDVVSNDGDKKPSDSEDADSDWE